MTSVRGWPAETVEGFGAESAGTIAPIETDQQSVITLVLRYLRGADGAGNLAARYLLDQRGARARVCMTRLAAQFGDGSNEQVNRVAEIIELQHLACACHSLDVTETSTPTAATNKGTLASRANSAAVLRGDVLLARANLIAAQLGPSATATLAAVMERFCLARICTAGLAGPYTSKENRWRTLVDMSRNSFIAGAHLALIFSHTPQPLHPPILQFAQNIGVAFQLTDGAAHVIPDDDRLEATARSETAHWVKSALRALDALADDVPSRALRRFAERISAAA